MDDYAARELSSIRGELQSIIQELEDISRGIERDFSGIGNKQCAECINRVVSQYRTAKSKLDNIDTSDVTEEFLARTRCY